MIRIFIHAENIREDGSAEVIGDETKYSVDAPELTEGELSEALAISQILVEAVTIRNKPVGIMAPKWRRGDILLLHKRWPGALLVVDEPKSFGAQGYLVVPAIDNEVSLAYLRVNFDEAEVVGHTPVVLEPQKGEEDGTQD